MRPHRAATRSHQLAIVLRSHHDPQPLVTFQTSSHRGCRTACEVIAIPLPCINHQPPIMTLFLVTAEEYLGLITSPHKVTSIHRSRHAFLPPHKYFGVYHAITNLYPSWHALIITKHLSSNAPSPGYRPQPPTGHRPQVAAGVPAKSSLPSVG